MSDLPKFSATERLIIELLAAHEELFGLQMVELSDGRLKRGTVYVTLGRMQEKGYLESRQEPLPEGAIGLPRRLYRPTGFAMRVLAAWQAAEQMYITGVEAAGGVMAITYSRARLRLAVVRRSHRARTFRAAGRRLAARVAGGIPCRPRSRLATRPRRIRVRGHRIQSSDRQDDGAVERHESRREADRSIHVSRRGAAHHALRDQHRSELAQWDSRPVDGASGAGDGLSVRHGGAVDAIRGHEALPPHVERAVVTKLAMIAVALMVFFHGWVVPAANQAWRTNMMPAGMSAPARGVRELTTMELINDPSRAHARETTNAGSRAAVIRRELNNRANLALLPALLLWLRWGMLESAAAALVFAAALVASEPDVDRRVPGAERYRRQPSARLWVCGCRRSSSLRSG